MSAAEAAAVVRIPNTRIGRRFADLKAQKRGGLVTFVTAGDPDPETSFEIIRGLPAAGADIIEIGMPFTDPMADGPAIQASGLRALKAGMTVRKTLALVKRFRTGDGDTPIVLMGYYNPIYAYGVDAFVADAADAGVDGLIVVDLPPEEDEELRPIAAAAGLDFIRLTTPTTDENRIGTVLNGASGFIYHVAVAGITGTRSAEAGVIDGAVRAIRAKTDLPVVVGFGIKTADQAASVARAADAAVVGSAIVSLIAETLREDHSAGPDTVSKTLDFVGHLARAARVAKP